LRSELKQTYYIGVSDDPEKRCTYHNTSNKGYTQRYRPWEVVYTYGFYTKEQALAAESKVKSWKSKKMIGLLIKGEIDIKEYFD
jgi:predicted GIY-YIG superfamily endonuclease